MQALDSSSLPLSEQTKAVQDAIACLERAACLVDTLGLFSSNETADDLATADIKYLLVPHHHATLLARLHQANDPEARLESVRAASAMHAAFLARLQQYGMLSEGVARSVAAFESDGAAVDATPLRQRKVERFKLEKSMKARLQVLERLSKSEGVDGDEESEDSSSVDDAALREMQLLRVELAALQSVEALSTLKHEAEVLAYGLTLPREELEAQRAQQRASHPDLIAQLKAAAGQLRGEASRREEIRAGVFRASHILPTLTVEQQGDIEVAEMMARHRLEEQQKQAAAAEDALLSAEEREDRDVFRVRDAI